MTRTLPVLPARRLLATVAALTAAFSVASCGSIDAGAAAVVGDRRISVAEVQTATTELQQVTGPDGGFDQRGVLTLLILEPVITQLAVTNGVGISAADARSKLTSKVPNPNAATVEAAQAVIAFNTMFGQGATLPQAAAVKARADFIATLKAAHIEVNPRFGRFDPVQVGIVPATQNWLVATATPTPTPSPAAS